MSSRGSCKYNCHADCGIAPPNVFRQGPLRMRHAFAVNESPRTELARLFARTILRLHRHSALSLPNPSEQSAPGLDVAREPSVTVLPTGYQNISQRKGPQR